jgi:hypothetical protein
MAVTVSSPTARHIPENASQATSSAASRLKSRPRHTTCQCDRPLVTARLNGVAPWAYLKDVLERIDGHRVDRLHELLPMHWKATAA